MFQKANYIGKKTAGFVPTMGALHSGHLQLMEQAKRENDLGIASIFVNPTQFSAGEDFDKYPRQVEKDIDLLKSINMDVLFLPQPPDIYPKNTLCHVEPTAFNSIHEGRARPEFFRGVATIVCKLFNIVLPTQSYFGQKDISQCILVKQMVRDLNMDTKVNIVETIRDHDGLALSSRNAYLTEEERKHADVLYKALVAGKQLCELSATTGEIPRDHVIHAITTVLEKERLVTQIEYISIASHESMKEVETVDSMKNGAVLSAAIRVGKVRLIDNLLVGKAHEDILRNL
jgi:pantoate--beta-alanine ligase